MKLHPIALLVGLATLAIAPTASANLPIVNASTRCAEGSPAVDWVVAMQSSIDGGSAPVDENRNVSVEISVNDNGVWGAWTQIAVGELTFLNGHTFSGTETLPFSASQVKLRVAALNWWTVPGCTNDESWTCRTRNTSTYWAYAVFTTNESLATAFDLPASCTPLNPGTGTPGYWKNHPSAWPVSSLQLGDTTYTQAQLIDILGGSRSRDATYILGRALIAALLNGIIGNDISCIDAVLDDAQAWLSVNPIGSGLRASSDAWSVGGPIATTLDDYNNGLLCAPHRD